MTERPTLPRGMTPRLLSRERAAEYCDLSPGSFDTYIASKVAPLEFGKRKVWDRKALDRWLDAQSGLGEVQLSHEWDEILG